MINYVKRISAMVCVIMLTALATVTFFADSSSSAVLDDRAGIFNSAQTAQLQTEMDTLAQKTGWQVVIHTSNKGISSDEMEDYYNIYYHDRQSFKKDCILFVIDTASSHRVILAYGNAEEYLPSYRIKELQETMKSFLNQNDMFGASKQFITETGNLFNKGKPSKLLESLKKYGLIIAIAAIVSGGAVTLIVFFKYRNNGKSGTYDLQSNSVTNLTEKEDIFLHERVTSRTISTDSGSSSRGGGSSSGGGSSHSSGGSF